MKPKSINTNHQKQLKSIGSYFREFRLGYGLTQKELSQNTNVHSRTIQRLEKGENVTLLSVIEIGETLGIDIIKELIGG